MPYSLLAEIGVSPPDILPGVIQPPYNDGAGVVVTFPWHKSCLIKTAGISEPDRGNTKRR